MIFGPFAEFSVGWILWPNIGGQVFCMFGWIPWIFSWINSLKIKISFFYYAFLKPSERFASLFQNWTLFPMKNQKRFLWWKANPSPWIAIPPLGIPNPRSSGSSSPTQVLFIVSIGESLPSDLLKLFQSLPTI